MKENAPNKLTKLGAGSKNLCILNDFKEGDKIDFEADNIPNNEIRFEWFGMKQLEKYNEEEWYKNREEDQ